MIQKQRDPASPLRSSSKEKQNTVPQHDRKLSQSPKTGGKNTKKVTFQHVESHDSEFVNTNPQHEFKYSNYKSDSRQDYSSSGMTRSTKFATDGGNLSRKFNFHPAAATPSIPSNPDPRKPIYNSVRDKSNSRSGSRDQKPLQNTFERDYQMFEHQREQGYRFSMIKETSAEDELITKSYENRHNQRLPDYTQTKDTSDQQAWRSSYARSYTNQQLQSQLKESKPTEQSMRSHMNEDLNPKYSNY